MARESQTLQITLIASVMLNLIVGVVAYLMWRQYDEANAKAAASDKKAQEAQTQATNAQAEAARLKQIIGFAPTDAADAIQTKVNEEMAAHAALLPKDYPASDRVYRKVLDEMHKTIRNLEKSRDDALAVNRQLETQLQNQQAAAKAAEDPLNKRAADAERDRADLQAQFARERARLTSERDQFAKQLQEVSKQSEEKLNSLQATLDKGTTHIRRLEIQVKDLRQQVGEFKGEKFERPLGRIISVNQAQRTAYINLGQADQLNPLTTFTVYDADTTDVLRSQTKANLEVTRVLGPHMAEARIFDDKPGNPVLKDDVIYTSVWRPGQRVHYALNGVVIDIDGDGQSDLDLIRTLIRMNGGLIDLICEGGKRQGEMTTRTDYLVRGTPPDEKTASGVRQAYVDTLTEAERLLVKQMDLKDLLARMGWRKETRVQQYGPTASAKEFGLPPPAGAQRVSHGSVSPLYTPREPSRGRITGTY
ncbi:MAG: hypothetical protein ACUVUC_01700 [Thermoguttaceae bacterium]